MAEVANDTLTLTREELYEQVWSEPMWTLAPRLGLSDVGLAKTCRRMKIPVPGRGYWAKKQAGYAVRRTNLPKLSVAVAAALGTVSIRSVAAKRAARERRANLVEQELSTIVVADVLTDPHPLVAHTIKALRRLKPNREGVLPRAATVDYLDVRVTLGTVDRAMLILDALIKALDERDVEISIDVQSKTTSTRAHVLGEMIPFHIDEHLEQVEVEEQKRPSHQHEWTPRPEKRTVGSGELGFYIDVGWLHQEAGSIRKSWRDGNKQRLEDCLSKIVTGLFEAAKALKLDREVREEQERRWQEQRRRERRVAWEKNQEKRRREVLSEDIQGWRLLNELQAFSTARRAAGPPVDGAERWSAWSSWVEDYSARLEARLLKSVGPESEPFDENAHSSSWG
jgi:hypothetical protein